MRSEGGGKLWRNLSGGTDLFEHMDSDSEWSGTVHLSAVTSHSKTTGFILHLSLWETFCAEKTTVSKVSSYAIFIILKSNDK